MILTFTDILAYISRHFFQKYTVRRQKPLHPSETCWNILHVLCSLRVTDGRASYATQGEERSAHSTLDASLKRKVQSYLAHLVAGPPVRSVSPLEGDRNRDSLSRRHALRKSPRRHTLVLLRRPLPQERGGVRHDQSAHIVVPTSSHPFLCTKCYGR